MRPAAACSRADLFPCSRTNLNESESAQQENGGHEEEQVQRGTDHRVPEPSHGRLPVKDPCRQGGFSEATFYKWRAKFGGLQVGEAARLRELEGEDAKLKKLLAEAHLDIHAPKSGRATHPARPA